jgi:peptidoglycan hydrolase-like protein with peptidoglycan-binding domain
MIDSACSSEKHGGGPAAYARCANNQVLSYRQSEPIPNMSGYDRKTRTMIDRACFTEKHGDGPAAYARCVANQLSGTTPNSGSHNRLLTVQPLAIDSGSHPPSSIITRRMFPSENSNKVVQSTREYLDIIAPPVVSQRAPSNKRNEEVYQVQFMLELLGYDPGPLDGENGPRTTSAIRKFRLDNGLESEQFTSALLLQSLRASIAEQTSNSSSIGLTSVDKLDPDSNSVKPIQEQDRFKTNVRNVQLALQAFGYYSGTINGVVNPITSEAITAMQTDYGLRITGTVTPEVFSALRIDVGQAK